MSICSNARCLGCESFSRRSLHGGYKWGETRGARLPFRDATFATTLISLALHHYVEPEAVLDEAVRVTRSQLIILESAYRNRWERFGLERLDDWLNRHRHNGAMHVPLAFKGPQEWQQSFDMRHLRTVERRWLGSWWERAAA